MRTVTITLTEPQARFLDRIGNGVYFQARALGLESQADLAWEATRVIWRALDELDAPPVPAATPVPDGGHVHCSCDGCVDQADSDRINSTLEVEP